MQQALAHRSHSGNRLFRNLKNLAACKLSTLSPRPLQKRPRQQEIFAALQARPSISPRALPGVVVESAVRERIGVRKPGGMDCLTHWPHPATCFSSSAAGPAESCGRSDRIQTHRPRGEFPERRILATKNTRLASCRHPLRSEGAWVVQPMRRDEFEEASKPTPARVA